MVKCQTYYIYLGELEKHVEPYASDRRHPLIHCHALLSSKHSPKATLPNALHIDSVFVMTLQKAFHDD